MQGGVGDFTRELGKGLAALGHSVHITTSKWQASDKLPIANRQSPIRVHREITRWDWSCWKQVLWMAQEEQLDVLNIQFQTAAYGMHPESTLCPSANIGRRWW